MKKVPKQLNLVSFKKGTNNSCEKHDEKNDLKFFFTPNFVTKKQTTL